MRTNQTALVFFDHWVNRQNCKPVRLRIIFMISALILTATIALAAQVLKPLGITDIRELLKSGISSTRIAQIIEQHGVSFELTDAVAKQSIRDGADETVHGALKRASDRYVKELHERNRLAEEAKKKALEQARLREEERKRADAERQRLAELERKQQDEARRREEAKKKQDEQRAEEERSRQVELERKRLADEARRKAEEEQAAAKAQEKTRVEGARTRELEQPRAKAAEEENRLANPKTAVAPAPPCTVGLRHQFEYADGDRFTRTITKREGNLCVLGRFYYDHDWKLVKQIETDGRQITAAGLESPFVGQSYLKFPLSVGKQWDVSLRFRNSVGGGVGSYRDYFTIVGFERVTVRAGRFNAFKIRHERRSSVPYHGVRYFWYSPEAEYYIKLQHAPDESTPANYWTARDYELILISKPIQQRP